MNKIIRLIACLLLIAGLSSQPARATLVADLTPPVGLPVECGECGTFGESLGWTFTVINAITIDGLGMWDVGADGLGVASQPIGLWATSTQKQLATVTVTDNSTQVASAASAYGVWLFGDIAPLTLEPGNYTIGAFFNKSVPLAINSGTYTTIADIAFGESRWSFPDSGFLMPYASLDSLPYFGPTMRLSTAGSAVPEPSTLALLGLGLAGLAATRRRTQAQAVIVIA